MATQSDLLAVLRDMHARGQSTVRANSVAEALWPNGRTHNANGQVFTLSAGAAGRMLRACNAVSESSPREWQILAHRLVS